MREGVSREFLRFSKREKSAYRLEGLCLYIPHSSENGNGNIAGRGRPHRTPLSFCHLQLVALLKRREKEKKMNAEIRDEPNRKSWIFIYKEREGGR